MQLLCPHGAGILSYIVINGTFISFLFRFWLYFFSSWGKCNDGTSLSRKYQQAVQSQQSGKDKIDFPVLAQMKERVPYAAVNDYGLFKCNWYALCISWRDDSDGLEGSTQTLFVVIKKEALSLNKWGCMNYWQSSVLDLKLHLMYEIFNMLRKEI